MLKTPNIIVSHFFINGETIKYNLNVLKLIEINKIFVLLFSLIFIVKHVRVGSLGHNEDKNDKMR